MKKILLVDDDENILAAYKRHLLKKYKVATSMNGDEGLIVLKEHGPFAVVVSDYRMPGMDGIEFLSAARKVSPDTVRVMLTGQADMQAAIDAINQGNLFRFLTKPCTLINFVSTLNAAVEQYELVTSEKELLEKTLKGSIKILMDILSLLSPAAFSQSSRIRNLAKKLAVRLDMGNSWEVELAAMLSQIGCVTIPADILEKKYRGESLTNNEKAMFLSHPQAGKRLLANIPRLEGIAGAIGYQEKNYDGSGMPEDSVQGKDIPLASRILKVAVDYEMLLASGKKPDASVDYMRKLSKRYDPDVMAALDAEINSVEDGFIVRALKINRIKPGMILADDIRDVTGVVLVPKGYEITDMLKTRLLNFSSFGNVMEPVKVLESINKKTVLQ